MVREREGKRVSQREKDGEIEKQKVKERRRKKDGETVHLLFPMQRGRQID